MAFKRVRTKGAGNVFSPEQLTEDLQALADEIKLFMFAEAQASGKRKFLKSGGIIEDTKVQINKDGIKIALPDYAQYIDGGRLPGTKKVPLDALITWIRRYRIGGRNSKGRFTKRTENSVNSLAFAIQTNIYKHGIKARPFLEKPIKFGEELLASYIEESLIPDIVTLIEFSFADDKK